jgi:PAS domain S-box-containing protein
VVKSSTAEFNDFAKAFRKMTEDLQFRERERKRAEDALRKAKDELEERVKERTHELYTESLYARSLIEASLDPLVTISADGKITDVNYASEKATGVPREQLIGRDFSDYFAEPEKARAGYEEVFRQGFVRDYPLGLRHQDGHVTPVLYNASVYRDETGQIMGVFAAARDITERKRAEETAKAERQRLYDVLETLPVYAILLTPDYHVSFANRFFRERFGEDRGKCCYEYLFNRVEPCEICETYTVQKTGKPHHWEWTGPDERNYDIFDFPFRDSDGSPLIMEVGVDITQRKQAEAALRKLASELVMAEEQERKRIAGVLHDEIAQTLAAARMRLDLLQSVPSDQKDKQTLQDAKAFLAQSIQETRALMNDLGNPVLFDLGLKAACEALAKRLMEAHSVRISCEIQDAYKHLDPDVKAIVFQVVRELLNNIAKHSQAQNARVMIDTEDGHFRVQITDDGVGFDSRTLGTPTNEGGFGLYSIRERLIAMNGSLKIESAPGTGTAVTAILPEKLD